MGELFVSLFTTVYSLFCWQGLSQFDLGSLFGVNAFSIVVQENSFFIRRAYGHRENTLFRRLNFQVPTSLGSRAKNDQLRVLGKFGMPPVANGMHASSKLLSMRTRKWVH